MTANRRHVLRCNKIIAVFSKTVYGSHDKNEISPSLFKKNEKNCVVFNKCNRFSNY